MAAWFNKWLLFLIIPAGLYISGKNQPADCSEPVIRNNINAHPFHVSVTEINHNAADKTLEITSKVFRDDFEKVLIQNYPQSDVQKTRVDLINPTDKMGMEKLVNDYIQKHFSIRADGKLVQFSGIGFEHENEEVYCYLQVANIASVKKIELTNSILFDLFTDQLSIMHVIVGGNRKSSKLNYPDTRTSFSF